MHSNALRRYFVTKVRTASCWPFHSSFDASSVAARWWSILFDVQAAGGFLWHPHRWLQRLTAASGSFMRRQPTTKWQHCVKFTRVLMQEIVYVIDPLSIGHFNQMRFAAEFQALYIEHVTALKTFDCFKQGRNLELFQFCRIPPFLTAFYVLILSTNTTYHTSFQRYESPHRQQWRPQPVERVSDVVSCFRSVRYFVLTQTILCVSLSDGIWNARIIYNFILNAL